MVVHAEQQPLATWRELRALLPQSLAGLVQEAKYKPGVLPGADKESVRLTLHPGGERDADGLPFGRLVIAGRCASGRQEDGWAVAAPSGTHWLRSTAGVSGSIPGNDFLVAIERQPGSVTFGLEINMIDGSVRAEPVGTVVPLWKTGWKCPGQLASWRTDGLSDMSLALLLRMAFAIRSERKSATTMFSELEEFRRILAAHQARNAASGIRSGTQAGQSASALLPEPEVAQKNLASLEPLITAHGPVGDTAPSGHAQMGPR